MKVVGMSEKSLGSLSSSPPVKSSSLKSTVASSVPRPILKNRTSSTYSSYYKARSSTLDRAHLEESSNPFRGFFTLFWVIMGCYMLITIARHYERHGQVFSLWLFGFFVRNFFTALLQDGLILITMLPILGFEWMVSRGWIPWRWLELTIQHAYQTTWFLTHLYLISTGDHSWVQTLCLTLHSVAMLMKIHSYAARNSHFNQLNIKSQKLRLLLKGELENTERAALEEELADIESELCPGHKRYPQNITIRNWIFWLIVPTFVYELYYPRTEKVRVWYILEKMAATMGTFWLLYITVEHYIVPSMRHASTQSGFFEMLPSFMIPFMIGYLLLFYIIFECICNAVAEVTRYFKGQECVGNERVWDRFADRSFYDDWWNSISYDEFARKWNKPVHHFLLRHVYHPLRINLKLPKFYALLCTFLFSAVIHELVVVMVARKFRMYFFLMQMFQIPLIMVAELIGTWGTKTFGNWFFWIGMMIGPALLTYAYTHDVFPDEHIYNHPPSPHY